MSIFIIGWHTPTLFPSNFEKTIKRQKFFIHKHKFWCVLSRIIFQTPDWIIKQIYGVLFLYYSISLSLFLSVCVRVCVAGRLSKFVNIGLSIAKQSGLVQATFVCCSCYFCYFYRCCCCWHSTIIFLMKPKMVNGDVGLTGCLSNEIQSRLIKFQIS